MAQRKHVIPLVLLAIALTASVVSAAVLLRDYRQVSAHYGIESVDANATVCPGQPISYTVLAVTEKLPAVLEIVESWCEAETTGRCSLRLTTVQHLAVARPHAVAARTFRIVPDDPFFQPGKKIRVTSCH